MRTYLNNGKPLILAHRGGGGEAAENSLAAFQQAVKLGCTYLETDVRLATDGKLYLRHGAASLLPNQLLRMSDMVPYTALSELFEALPGCFFAIDPKHSRAVEPLARLIVQYGLENNVCIGSSLDGRTKRTAQLIEKLSGKRPCTALVSVPAIVKLLLMGYGLPIRQRKMNASYIHVPARLVNRYTVRAAHEAGLKIIAWVLNDDTSMRKALALGVDGFMTDFPSVAVHVAGKQTPFDC